MITKTKINHNALTYSCFHTKEENVISELENSKIVIESEVCSLEEIKYSAGQEGIIVVAKNEENEIVGYAFGYYHSTIGNLLPYIENYMSDVYFYLASCEVREDYQGYMIGTVLVEELLGYLKEDVSSALLYAMESSKTFWYKNGFQVIQEDSAYLIKNFY